MDYLTAQKDALSAHTFLALTEHARLAWSETTPHRAGELLDAIDHWTAQARQACRDMAVASKHATSAGEWGGMLSNMAAAEMSDYAPGYNALRYIDAVGLDANDPDHERLFNVLSTAFE